MDRSFFHGLAVGIVAPLLVVKSLITIIHRATGRVLYIEKRDDALALVLIEPKEAATRTQDATLSVMAAAGGVKAFVETYIAGFSPGKVEREPDPEYNISI